MITFNFHDRDNDGSTLVTWRTESALGHALIHDAEQARDLAGLNLPGAVSEAAQAYLDREESLQAQEAP
ncbi:hypothetical protein [Paeniglutamicibacter terrestris]|uniref:Uncharacterized protein n=1 Tax=Paeniglutamicibacter terrestris TaxID=2723403 RepID=A0ABX1G4A9_9MICC|nr:hypothetical protein [Paeniglutamicibacter terrestris]NKG21081.1 hypothetical protein [Paeniglutamicibacter terrestris]